MALVRGMPGVLSLLVLSALPLVDARDVGDFLAKSAEKEAHSEQELFHFHRGGGFHWGHSSPVGGSPSTHHSPFGGSPSTHHSPFGGSPGSTVQYHHSTYGDEVKKAFISALVGFLLVVLAFPLLYFNEKRQVHMEKIFHYGRKVVRCNIPADKVDPQFEANLVHVQGETACAETLQDPDFGISVSNCAHLCRDVEMYQWEEKRNEEERDAPGGGKDTIVTYTYELKWSSLYHDSSSFQEAGHDNPPMPLSSMTKDASSVSFGAFNLPADMISQMHFYQSLSGEELSQCVSAGGRSFSLVGERYTTESDSGPSVGDMHVKFTKVPCGAATVLSVQHDDSFVPLTYDLVPTPGLCPGGSVPDKIPIGGGGGLGAPLLPGGMGAVGAGEKGSDGVGCLAVCDAAFSLGESLHNLKENNCSAPEMFSAAEGSQKFIVLCMRIVGFMMFYIGFAAMFSFVPTIFRIIPFIGVWIQAFGNFFASLAAFFFSVLCWCTTVAVSWLALRPLKGAVLLVIAVAAIYIPTMLCQQ